MAWRNTVIALPRQLAPWDSQLALFPEDIALVLGPMVARLSAVIGGASFDHAPEGLPDGFDGIAARGSYDRLLAAEWALLDESPDEFLRRAISGEHLFLQQAFQTDSAAKQTVALFDAGAEQLGAPRLAQLAILIALAKRAEDIGATLKWGVFQDENPTLSSSVTAALVRKLLRARCVRPAVAADIARWMAAPEVLPSSEIWFIGAEAMIKEAQHRNVSALAVSDALEPGAPQRIHVRALASGSSRAREVFLEAPQGPEGARILRDPFGLDVGGRSTSARVDVRSSIVFAVDGRKFFVAGEQGTLITVPVPNSPRAPVSRPQAFLPPPGHTVVAAGQTSKRRTIVVTQDEGELAVHTLSKRGGAAKRSEAFSAPDNWLAAPVNAALQPLGVFKSKYCFIDAQGNLIELNKDHTPVQHRLAAAASRAAAHSFAYVVPGEQKPLVMIALLKEGGEFEFKVGAPELPPMPQDSQYFFFAFGLCDLVAYSRQDAQCILVHELKITALDVPRSHEVIGALKVGEPEPMLVAVREDRMRVEGLRKSNWEVLFVTSSPIARVATSDAGPVIAYITDSGEIGVYSCVHHTTLLKVAAWADA